MKYIVENWFVIVGLIAVCAAGGYAVYVFVKMPSDKQLNKVREWLLYAVDYGRKGTGSAGVRIKSNCNMYMIYSSAHGSQWFARVISFGGFFDDGRRGT